VAARARSPPHARGDHCTLTVASSPADRCRYETWFCAWMCVDERQAYEYCQYSEFQRRQRVWKAKKEAGLV